METKQPLDIVTQLCTELRAHVRIDLPVADDVVRLHNYIKGNRIPTDVVCEAIITQAEVSLGVDSTIGEYVTWSVGEGNEFYLAFSEDIVKELK